VATSNPSLIICIYMEVVVTGEEWFASQVT
jgi:hypothetical protein